MRQGNLFLEADEALESPTKAPATSTFADNLSLPIHRWFRYSAGFSAIWVRELIRAESAKNRRRVLDPFAGSGTVLLEAEFCGVQAIGIEAHPFVSRITRAKLLWHEDPPKFRKYALSLLESAKKIGGDIAHYPLLILKCFPTESLQRLDSLRKAWESEADGSPYSELAWLALASILRECSSAGTAPWQYVLPKKSKSKIVDPFSAFESKIYLMSGDMSLARLRHIDQRALFYQEDARQAPSIPDSWADLVITSPPYANNYDYADATRLEMSFFGEIQGWGELQDTVRRFLIPSCTQHVAKLNGETYKILEEPVLGPIRGEITETCKLLESERANHGGKKPYHTMIAAYFHDMAKMWVELRRMTAENALVCFVVGDSAPYGVYVPVDRWLGELALAAGFRSFSFEKLRSRNIKWKNRKHRVPLHEGYLWIGG